MHTTWEYEYQLWESNSVSYTFWSIAYRLRADKLSASSQVNDRLNFNDKYFMIHDIFLPIYDFRDNQDLAVIDHAEPVSYLLSWSPSYLEFVLQITWPFSIFTPGDLEAKSLGEIPSDFSCWLTWRYLGSL